MAFSFNIQASILYSAKELSFMLIFYCLQRPFQYIECMLKSILKNSIDYMKNDRKIIRLTLATSFFHSLIASLLIILNINTLFARNYENGLYVGKVAEFFVNEINNNHIINRVIGIAIILFIAYSLVYPIGQTAIIHYLNNKNISIRKSLKK